MFVKNSLKNIRRIDMKYLLKICRRMLERLIWNIRWNIFKRSVWNFSFVEVYLKDRYEIFVKNSLIFVKNSKNIRRIDMKCSLKIHWWIFSKDRCEMFVKEYSKDRYEIFIKNSLIYVKNSRNVRRIDMKCSLKIHWMFERSI